MREITEKAFVQSLGYLKNLHRVVFSKGLKQFMVVTDDGRSLDNQEEIYTRHIDYKSMYRFGIAARQLGEAANVVAPMIRNMGDAIAHLNSQVKLPWYKRVFKRRK